MIAFIADHREAHGVEPICKPLPIAPPTYHLHAARRADPALLPARAKRGEELTTAIRRVHQPGFRLYGVRKLWRRLRREGIAAARRAVERLMRGIGLAGVVRGKPAKTTVQDRATPCPADPVNRQFRPARPNLLWVSEVTCVVTWQGFVCLAFVIGTFARRIVGWRVSRTAHAGFVPDALEQALHERRPVEGGLVHHGDLGVQHVCIRHTERLADAGIAPSAGRIGDSYDNALAETIIGLFKAEVIRRAGPWRGIAGVEFATLEWVGWFHRRRLLAPIGHVPPRDPFPWRHDPDQTASGKSGAVHLT